MTSMHWDFTEALCRCVRAFTDSQGMRFTGIRDLRNYRRFIAPLEAHDYVQSVTVLAKPVPEMREPLFASVGNGVYPEDRFSECLRLARARWAGLPAVPTRCVVATKRAGHLFGVRRTGQLGKPLQASHDLAVSEALLAVAPQIEVIEHWYGEDFADFRIGEKLPDAVILDAKKCLQKVIEVVGADYDEAKLSAIHQECNARGITYELW